MGFRGSTTVWRSMSLRVYLEKQVVVEDQERLCTTVRQPSKHYSPKYGIDGMASMILMVLQAERGACNYKHDRVGDCRPKILRARR